jgi:polyisoprenoid-binding protein YceI
MRLSISLILLAISCQGFSQTASLDYLIAEPAYSTIEFSVPIANGITRVTGKFTVFTIDIELIDNDITKSRIKAVIHVNSLTTGNASRDRVLMSNIFFDAKKFPKITFVSDRIVKRGDRYVVSGLFNMHGLTRPIELEFSVTGTLGDDVIGFSSRYSLLRSAYNIGTEYRHANYDNFIDNEVGIQIDFWTKRKPRERK